MMLSRTMRSCTVQSAWETERRLMSQQLHSGAHSKTQVKLHDQQNSWLAKT